MGERRNAYSDLMGRHEW